MRLTNISFLHVVQLSAATIDREIFALKIFRCSTVPQRSAYTHFIFFARLIFVAPRADKNILTAKIFPIYYIYIVRVPVSIFFLLSLYRRDRLWIAMEYCGGGSLQDIYHGTLRVRLISVQC